MNQAQRKVDHTYHDFSSVKPDEEPGPLNRFPTYIGGGRVHWNTAATSREGEATLPSISSAASQNCMSSSQQVARPKARGTDWNFPAKLHFILSSPVYSDVITWMPHGRSFRILDQVKFINKTSPNVFDQKQFPSFQRQLNGWGFKLLTNNREAGNYYHEMFLQGMPHLTKLMTRPLKSNEGRQVPDPGNEPDFCKIHEDFPLPVLKHNLLNPMPLPLQSYAPIQALARTDSVHDNFEREGSHMPNLTLLSNNTNRFYGRLPQSQASQSSPLERIGCCGLREPEHSLNSPTSHHLWQHNQQAPSGAMFSAPDSPAQPHRHDARSDYALASFPLPDSCLSKHTSADFPFEGNDRDYKMSADEQIVKSLRERTGPAAAVDAGDWEISASGERDEGTSVNNAHDRLTLMHPYQVPNEDELDLPVSESIFYDDFYD